MIPFPTTIIASDGKPGGSCLFHRQFQWQSVYVTPHLPRCSICGGVCLDKDSTAHYLCEVLKRRGLPTPQRDNAPRCGCAKCAQMKMT